MIHPARNSPQTDNNNKFRVEFARCEGRREIETGNSESRWCKRASWEILFERGKREREMEFFTFASFPSLPFPCRISEIEDIFKGNNQVESPRRRNGESGLSRSDINTPISKLLPIILPYRHHHSLRVQFESPIYVYIDVLSSVIDSSDASRPFNSHPISRKREPWRGKSINRENLCKGVIKFKFERNLSLFAFKFIPSLNSKSD